MVRKRLLKSVIVVCVFSLIVALILTACAPATPATVTQAPATTTATATVTKTQAPATTTATATVTASVKPTLAPKTLVIGCANSLTGWFSSYDVQLWNEMNVLRDIVNEHGGITINGQQYLIDLTVEDCKSSLDGTTAAVQRLIYDKKVKFINGPSAFFTMAASPECAANQVVQVSGYNVQTPLECGPKAPYSFIGANSAVACLSSLLEIVKSQYPNAKSVTLVSPAAGTNDYLGPASKDYITSHGYTIKGDWVTFPDDAVDYAPYASKLNDQSKNSDIILGLQGIAFHLGSMLKSLREIKCNKEIVWRTPTFCQDILTICGPDAAWGITTHGVSYKNPKNPPILDELITRYKANYGEGTPYNTQDNTMALYTLIKVIEKVQSIDPVVVKTGWENLEGQSVDTLMGPGVICGTKT